MIEQVILKIKRGETPLFLALRRFIRGLMYSNLPVPGIVKPFYRFLYHTYFAAWYASRWFANYFFREPAFRSRCVKVGKRLTFTLQADITGHPEIYIGDDVNLYGKIGVTSGRLFKHPRLVIEDHVDVGHLVSFVVNKEIVIEKGVHIASHVRIVDSDGHPRDPALRAADLPPAEDEVKPVRIAKYAWLGHGCYIMKGVTVGEGAIIGAASVVVTDIPPFSVAMGNPARVVVKDFRKQPAVTPVPTSTAAS